MNEIMNLEKEYLCIAIFSIYLLLRVREITGKTTFSDIGYFCYGRVSIFLINSLVAIAQLGFPIIFFIVFGDVAGGLIGKINSSGINFWESRWFTHILLAGCMLYLVLKKDISSLRYVGLVCFILIISFICLYFIHYASSNPSDNPKADLAESHPTLRFWASIPTILTSYAIHTSYYVGFNSLKEKTTKNGLKAGIISLLIMFFTYQASSLISYGLYGENIKSNMLIGLLSSGGIIPIILLIIFLLIAVMHIPIIFYIGKEAILIMFDELTRRSYSKKNAVIKPIEASPKVQIEIGLPIPNEECSSPENNQESEEQKDIIQEGGEVENNDEVAKNNDIEAQSNDKDIACHKEENENSKTISNPREYLNMRSIYYYLITVFVFIFVVITSIVVGDVNIVFGIIGSVVSCFMVLAGPGSFYIIAIYKKEVKFTGKWSVLTYILAWVYTIVGFICMVTFKMCVIFQ